MMRKSVAVFVVGILVLMTRVGSVYAYGSISVSDSVYDSAVYVDATQYGQARHFLVDNYGNLVMAYVNGTSSTISEITLGYSNDSGANWTSVTGVSSSSANRPAMAYDSVNDKVHMVYQETTSSGANGLIYNRFSISRNGSNQITGFVSDGTLEMEKFNTRRPAIMWTSDGGSGGTVVVTWIRQNDAGSVHHVVASMRNISNTAADFTAGNWKALDGSSDSLASITTQPNVARDVVDGNTASTGGDNAISCVVQRPSTASSYGRDVYIVYTLFDGSTGATVDKLAWKKATWSSANNDWSGGWNSSSVVVTGNFASGKLDKELSLGCVYDDVNHYVWFSSSRFASSTDYVSLYALDASDGLVSAGDVYSTAASASRIPMIALGFDSIEQGGKTWVAYVTGDGSQDGYVLYKSYKVGTGFVDSGQIIATANPYNYPNILEFRYQGYFMVMARRTDSGNENVHLAKISLTSNPAKPTGLGATAGAGSVSLSWTAPSYSGGASVTDYVVEYRAGSSGSFSTFSDGTSTSTSATVTGLTPGTSYQFRVSASNANGTSNPSSTASATPDPLPTATPTSTPSPSPTPSPTPTPSPVIQSTSSSAEGGGVGGGEKCPSGWVRCISVGPSLKSAESGVWTSAIKNPRQASLFAHNDIANMDVFLTIEGLSQAAFNQIYPQFQLPWQQGWNVVGDIYNFSAVSAFNGYGVRNLNKPVIIQLAYDKDRLFGRDESELQIVYFNLSNRRWQAINPGSLVTNRGGKTVANTTKQLGLYVVAYPRLGPETKKIKAVLGSTVVIPSPTLIPKPTETITKTDKKRQRCILWWCW